MQNETSTAIVPFNPTSNPADNHISQWQDLHQLQITFTTIKDNSSIDISFSLIIKSDKVKEPWCTIKEHDVLGFTRVVHLYVVLRRSRERKLIRSQCVLAGCPWAAVEEMRLLQTYELCNPARGMQSRHRRISSAEKGFTLDIVANWTWTRKCQVNTIQFQLAIREHLPCPNKGSPQLWKKRFFVKPLHKMVTPTPSPFYEVPIYFFPSIFWAKKRLFWIVSGGCWRLF